MSNTERPDGDLTPEERRRLETWKTPEPPPGFSAGVVARARAQGAAAPTTRTAPLSRAERERRRRRRSAVAALLGAVAVSAGGGFVATQSSGAADHAMTVYLVALAFGGVLLIASLIGGHGHADHDAGHADAHGDHDGDHGADADAAAHAALVLPFLSLRFWIFGLTFFGLTGAILHGLGLAGPLATAIIASVMGLGMGYGAAHVLQKLTRETVGQIPADGGHVGREGKLLLPTARGQRGKMRVVVNGVAVDLLTETDEEQLLPAGTAVLIVGMRGTVAVVERSPTSTPPTEQGEQP